MFIYLFPRQSKREREMGRGGQGDREGEREGERIFHLLVHAPNGHNGLLFGVEVHSLAGLPAGLRVSAL